MRNLSEDTITQAVIASLGGCRDERLRTVFTSLVQHLHSFAREVRLSEAEWQAAIGFLTGVGHITDDQRQEFILLSDVLGLSTLVTAQNMPSRRAVPRRRCSARSMSRAVRSTHATRTSPMAPQASPCFVRGRVLEVDGKPWPMP